MPWKERKIVEERLRFIARLLDGEKMAGLCREFGISRKTGYKIYNRYKDCGIEGLTDRSRRPYRHANQLPMQIEKLIVHLKKEYPHWGAIKIRARLRTSSAPPSAPSTPSSIGTAWSNARAADGSAPPAPPWRTSPSPTSSGAPTTRASSCSTAVSTATR